MSKKFKFLCGEFGCIATEVDPYVFDVIHELHKEVMTEYYRRYKVFPEQEIQAEFIMPVQEAIEKLLRLSTK